MLLPLRSAYRRKFRPSWPKAEPAEKLPWRDEFSDGCSFVADVKETVHCCHAHDRAYYEAVGGRRGRAKADREFLRCMKAAGWTWRARLRWLGVRSLGWIMWYT